MNNSKVEERVAYVFANAEGDHSRVYLYFEDGVKCKFDVPSGISRSAAIVEAIRHYIWSHRFRYLLTIYVSDKAVLNERLHSPRLRVRFMRHCEMQPKIKAIRDLYRYGEGFCRSFPAARQTENAHLTGIDAAIEQLGMPAPDEYAVGSCW